jgi:hypothetical protein
MRAGPRRTKGARTELIPVATFSDVVGNAAHDSNQVLLLVCAASRHTRASASIISSCKFGPCGILRVTASSVGLNRVCLTCCMCTRLCIDEGHPCVYAFAKQSHRHDALIPYRSRYRASLKHLHARIASIQHEQLGIGRCKRDRVQELPITFTGRAPGAH